ncbi:MAG: nucleotidyltransferase family protein [Cyclobacteriaceae bacterium]|jgi:uncharacterized protein|nr:nucleotidyltransferase family protein [Cyclobacteriaceae bacterium]
MTIDNIKREVTPILKKHGVSRAEIFGSISRGTEDSSSDVDILVKLGREMSLLEFVRIKIELEDFLGKKVDLVEYKSVKPRLKKYILSEESRIYG